MFPDDDTCLAHLFSVRFGVDPQCPKCGEVGKFHRLAKMPAYTCNCGHHIHPMAGTPFLRTRTSLQKWFYAMYLFTTTRNGVAAKELQRQLGVTYKTAWRMAKEIRIYMGWVDGDAKIGGPGGGIVEADKSFIGGYDRRGEDDKTIVLGMVERGGEVVTRIVLDKSAENVLPFVYQFVREGSRVATDTSRTFSDLRYAYYHATVNHQAKEYARGPIHTNTIEAFWSWFQRGVNGTHVWVSPKHMSKYLGEFEFRFNLRKSPHLMFPLLIASFRRP
jgi:hypothetical protein